MNGPIDFGPISLSPGTHEDPEHGMCVMEMCSFLAGEPWSFTPKCVSKVIRFFSVVGNDYMDQANRDRLQGCIPRLIDTVSEEHEETRRNILGNVFLGQHVPLMLKQEVSLVVDQDFTLIGREWANQLDIAIDFTSERSAINPLVTELERLLREFRFSILSFGELMVDEPLFRLLQFTYTKIGWSSYFDLLESLVKAGPSGERMFLPQSCETLTELHSLCNA